MKRWDDVAVVQLEDLGMIIWCEIIDDGYPVYFIREK